VPNVQRPKYYGLYNRSRSRSLRGYGYIRTYKRFVPEEVYERRRVRRSHRELKGEWLRSDRARTEICGERDASFTQLHPGLQYGVRSGGSQSDGYCGGPRSPSEMARLDSWSEGSSWTTEEEVFKGTREEVVSWIKGYAGNGGCSTDFRLLHGRKVPNMNEPTLPKDYESNQKAATPGVTLARIGLRLYHLIKSSLWKLWSKVSKAYKDRV